MDLSRLSDAELDALEKHAVTGDLSQLSDAQLDALEADLAPDTRANKNLPQYEGNPLSYGGKMGLELLTAPGKVIESGVDAAMGVGSFSGNLEKYYNADPAYTPGHTVAEKFATDPLTGEMSPGLNLVGQIGTDIATDPLTYLSGGVTAGARVAGAVPKMAATAEIPKWLSRMGGVGEWIGPLGPKWARGVSRLPARDVMQSGRALEETKAVYGPLKHAAQETMAGRAPANANEIFKLVTRESHPQEFSQLDAALQQLDDGIAEMQRAEIPVPADVLAERNRLAAVAEAGAVRAPETFEQTKVLNTWDYSPLGNQRGADPFIEGGEQASRGALENLRIASSPKFGNSMRKTSDLLDIINPVKGGKVSNWVSKAPVAAGTLLAGHELYQGDLKGALAAGIGTIILRSPKAWNMVAGSIRLTPEIAAQGAQGVTNFIASNPQALAVATEILMKSPEYASELQQTVLGSQTAPDPGNDTAPPEQSALDSIGQPMAGPMPAPQLPQTGKAANIFLASAQHKPQLFMQLSQIAGMQGNLPASQYFAAAAQIGPAGAFDMLASQYPMEWQGIMEQLPAIANAAIKSSPALKTELRRAVLDKRDIDEHERALLIQTINDNSVFDLP